MIFKTTTNRFGETRLGTNFGNIKDFFRRQNTFSDSDIKAIKEYNAQIDACVTSQTAFNRTMLNASKSAQDMVAKANGNIVSLGNLTKASKAAEVGLKALSIAGNMIVMWAISKGIEIFVEKIDG